FLKSFFRGKNDDGQEPAAQPDPQPQPEPEPERDVVNVSPTADAAPSDENAANEDLKLRVIEALHQIYDPEIPVDIYELGLIYEVRVSGHGDVHVVMTLTTPHCPVAESMPAEVETRVRDVENAGAVTVELVFDPPWDMTMMSEAARLELGFM
ncbi:MAG: DUF59 domain-containing protein, partial [Sphingomonadales bacterium]